MVMLTEVLRFEVSDRSGRRARASDLAIALLDDDYPPVTSLLIDIEGGQREIDWTNVESFEPEHKRIVVNDLRRARVLPESSDVLLRRDILDALILDLLGRRTTRVCDLLLERDDSSLRLKKADTGMMAMLRRVARGRLFPSDPTLMFDWKYVEFLRGDPAAVDNGAGYRLRINRLPAGEIARLVDYVPYLHAAELLKLLPDGKAAGVLEATPLDRQLQMIEELDPDEAIGLLSRMSVDLATDLIGRLELSMMRSYLSQMPQRRRDLIIELLRYPEDSVGGAMTNDVFAFADNMKCGDARKAVEENLDEVRFTSLIFVTGNKSEQLRGSINLRELLTADEEQILEEAMDPYLQTLEPFGNAADAAHRIVSGQLPAMPVIDEKARLQGAMTVEAAIARLVSTAMGVQRLRVFT